MPRFSSRLAVLLLPFVFSIPFTAPATHAAEIFVNTISDGIVDNDGRCTLREAIASANADQALHACTAGDGPDTIVLGSDSDHVMAVAGSGEDGNLTGDFDITDDLTIRPADNGVVVLDGAQLDRVFEVHGGANLTLERIRVQSGSALGFGGGILVLESGSELTLSSAVVSANQASLFGGGIASEGSVTIVDSFVMNNTANFGGGVYMFSPETLTLLRSDIRQNEALVDGGGLLVSTLDATESSVGFNSAEQDGGGIFWRDDGPDTDSYLTNSTVAYNESFRHGGGIYLNLGGSVSLFNSTVGNNAADSDANDSGDGGGVFVVNGTFRTWNSIFGANTDQSPTGTQAPDCHGAVESGGHNLFSAIMASDCQITGATASDLSGTLAAPLDPRLDSCLEPVGDSLAAALLPFDDSPAVDAADPTGCKDRNGVELVTDQAGHHREWDGPDADAVAICDIGAIELGAPSFLNIFTDDFESGDTSAWGTVVLMPQESEHGTQPVAHSLAAWRSVRDELVRGGCKKN